MTEKFLLDANGAYQMSMLTHFLSFFIPPKKPKENPVYTSNSSFKLLDANKLKAQYSITEKAEEDAHLELPSSSALSLEGVEKDFISYMNSEFEKENLKYENVMGSFFNSIHHSDSEITAALDKIKFIEKQTISDLDTTKLEYIHDIEEAHKKLQESKHNFEKFKKDNNLTLPARPRRRISSIIAEILICLVPESIANGVLFKEGNDLGLVGGATLSIMISSFNIIFGFVLGIFSRYILSKNILIKFCCVLSCLFACCFSIAYNLYIGHFRLLYVTTDTVSAAKNALNVFLENFIVTDFHSILLLLLGFIVFWLSFYNGHNIKDPTPRYNEYTDDYEKKDTNFNNLINILLQELSDQRDEKISEISNHINTILDTERHKRELYPQIISWDSKFNHFISHHNDVANNVISTYRYINKNNRTTPIPLYFKDNIIFTSHHSDYKSKLDAIESPVYDTETLAQTRENVFYKYNELLSELRNSIEGLNNETSFNIK